MTLHRKAQIEAALQRTLGRVLSQRLSDPRVRGLISVTRVTVSADLREAFVHVSVLPDEASKRVLAGLRHATGHIHGQLCRELSMKTVPRLDFRIDQTLKKQASVFQDITNAVEGREISGL